MRFRLLMPLSLRDDPGLTWAQREELEEHLLSCRACADEYEQDRQLSGLLRQCTPADRPHAAALQRWRSDVGALASVPPDRRGQVLLGSLQAGTYVANTRTAAWLWARQHPQEAARLLAGQAPPTGGPSPPTSANVQDWLDRLAQDVADCQAICQAAQELITLPSAQDCGEQATKLDAALAQAVGTMAGQAK